MNLIPIKKNKKIKKPVIVRKHPYDKTKKQAKENQINYIKNKINNNKINSKNIRKGIKGNNSSKFPYDNEINSCLGGKSIKEQKIYNNNKFGDILDKKDFELNSLDYEEAIKLDHRNYFEYYISLLKNNHPLMFSFSSYNDYNSKIIKIFLFFFSFTLDFTINALFFTDDTMHKIYQDKGKFNFLYQIPQILYSTFISRFIDSLIKNLSLSQDNINEFKQTKENNDLEHKNKKLLRALKIKFSLFFVFSFILLLFCWYYITCFCGIYINTQLHLIKDTIISLVTSLFIPFGMCLIPGIFRVPALRAGKHNNKCIYKFSAFLENYLG